MPAYPQGLPHLGNNRPQRWDAIRGLGANLGALLGPTVSKGLFIDYSRWAGVLRVPGGPDIILPPDQLPGVTFTRATPRYVMGPAGKFVQVGAGEMARAFDPLTGALKGLYMHQSAENTLYPSNSWAGWSNTDVTLSAGQTDCPIEGATSTKVTDVASTNFHQLFKNHGTATASIPLCEWHLIKKLGGTEPYVRGYFPSALFSSGQPRADFNFDTGEADNITDGEAGMEDLGDGWYLCWVSATPTLTSSGNSILRFGQASRAGNTNNQWLLAHSQRNLGARPAPLIPTSTGPVTHAGDRLVYALPSGFVDGDLTFLAKGREAPLHKLESQRFAQIGDETANRYDFVMVTSGAISSFSILGVSSSGQTGLPSHPEGDPWCLGTTIEAGTPGASDSTFKVFGNGAKTDEDLLDYDPTEITHMRVGGWYTSTSQGACGIIEQAALIPTLESEAAMLLRTAI